MSYLYGGSILFIDLSEGKVRKEPTSSYSKDFLGGRGINIKLLYDSVTPGTDAFDPSNLITFGTGPFTGTTCPGSGRTDIMAKSPITGLQGDSNVGGFWAPEVKRAGYDNIAITGKAEKPVYIWIDDDRVEIKDASQIWGKDTYETPILIREELDHPEFQVLSIGPAGENLVRFASVITDVGHAAGRTGMAAVMGSKMLKAIAVRGTKGVKVANPQAYLNYSFELHQMLRNDPHAVELSKYGTTRLHDEGMLRDPYFAAAANFQHYAWDEAPSFYEFLKKYMVRKVGCFGCPVRCQEFYSVPGVGNGVVSCNVYYGLIWAAKIANMETWFELAVNCNKLGIDTQSLGTILAWLMELHQRGIITAQDTDGIPMEWGSREAILGIQKKIAYREGFGDVIAEGILPAARKIGRGSEKYAMHEKGLPLLHVNFTARDTTSLAMAVGPRGDFLRGNFGSLENPETSEENIAAANIEMEDFVAETDSIGNCKFSSIWNKIPFGAEEQARLFSLGAGIDTTAEMLLAFGKRIRNLERAFDVREGCTRDDDTLPDRFLDNPMPDGKFKGLKLKRDTLEKMKDEYYRQRGWDIATGIPTRETLVQVGLKEVAEDLDKLGKLPLESAEEKKRQPAKSR